MRPELKGAVLVVAVLAIVGCLFMPAEESEAVDGDVSESTATSISDENLTTMIEGNTFKAGNYILTDDITLSSNVTLGGDVTLDLAGYTLSITKITVPADVTFIVTASGNGMITSSMNQAISVSSNGTFYLNGGTINGTSSIAVNVLGTFYMNGGTVIGASSYIVYNRGDSYIYAGTIGELDVTTAAGVFHQGRSLTIGETGTDGPTICSFTARGTFADTVNMYSGLVGRVVGDGFGDESTISGRFVQDMTDSVPAGYECYFDGEYYQVRPLSIENAAASIDGVLYQSLSGAASALGDGETLTVLKDYTGTDPIRVQTYNGIVDLGGHTITVTGAGAHGLEVFPAYGTDYDDAKPNSVTVYNGTIDADIPIYASSGGSMYVHLIIGDSLVLQSAADSPDLYLGSVAYTEYSDVVSALDVVGYMVEDSNGNRFIYGRTAEALQVDADHHITLLMDSNEIISCGVKDVVCTVNLNGHTVSVNSNAISIATSNVVLVVENGSVESTATGSYYGAILWDSNNSGALNSSLTLNDVFLTAAGDFGVYAHGIHTDVDVTINGGSVTAENGWGVYFPADGTLKINNASIEGLTGVEIRQGDLTITGEKTSITATGTYDGSDYNGSGTTTEGAAIVIAPYEADTGTTRDMSVMISDGTFTGDVAFVQANPNKTTSVTYSFSVTGGYFTSKGTDASTDSTYPAVMAESNAGRFIMGGSYSGGEGTSDFVVNGYSMNEQTGEVTIADPTQAVALVGSTYFTDFAKAVETAQSTGQELVMLKTVTLGNGESMSIDGISISMGDDLSGPLFTLYSGATLTLTDVNMTGNESGSEMISVGNGTVVLTSCTMKDNQAEAVYVNGGKLEMYDTTVSGMNNSDVYGGLGGAIFSMSGIIVIKGCTFENNTALENGGAIFANVGSLSVTDTVFSGNSARVGGTIGLQSTSDELVVTLDGVTITDSYAASMGGAIHAIVSRQDLADGGAWECPIAITIKDSTIAGSSNIGPYNGQAIVFYKLNTDADITLKLEGTCGIDGTIANQKKQDSSFVYGSAKIIAEDGFRIAEGYDPISLAYNVAPSNGTSIVSGSGADASMFSLYGQDQGLYENADGELVANKYVTVTFEMWDGDDEVQVIAGNNVVFPTSDRAGFIIDGWTKDGSVWTGTTTDADITLTPVWSFDPDSEGSATIEMSQGDKDMILEAGYQGPFEGVTVSYSWTGGTVGDTLHVTADGIYTVTVTLRDSINIETTPLVLTQSITVDENLVRFISDGVIVDSWYVPDGTNISEEDYPEPTKDGYMLWEWDGNTSNIADDVDVTAVWYKLYEVNVSLSGPLYRGDSITATVNVIGVEPGYTVLYMFGLEEGQAPDQLPQNRYTVTEAGSYLAMVLIFDGDTQVGVGGTEPIQIQYSERPVDPTPEPDPPYNPGSGDDDVYIPPSPPDIVVNYEPSSGDTTVGIAACAAAAVAAAIIACLIIMERRRS